VAFLEANTLSALLEKSSQNKTLEAQIINEKASRLQKDAIDSAYAPKIELIGAYNKKNNTVIFEPKEVKAAKLQASMIIFDGLKREAKRDALTEQLKAEEQNTEFMRQSIYLEIVKEYLAYFDAKETIDAIDFKLQELDAQIKKFQILVKNELATRDALEAMIASKKESEFERENGLLMLESAKAKLELYTNERVDSLVFRTLEEPPKSSANDRADIKADGHIASSLTHMQDTHSYLPSLIVQNTATKNIYSEYDDMSGAQKLPQTNNELSMQLSMTVFDYGLISKEREIAKLQGLQAAKNLSYKKDALQKEIKIANIALLSAKKRYEAALIAGKAQQIAYEFTKKRFEEGLATYSDYLTELSKNQSAKAREKSAAYAIESRKAELAFLLGIDLRSLVR